MKQLLDKKETALAIEHLAKEIINSENKLSEFVLVGIRSRGYPIAQRIALKIKELKKVEVPVGVVDITLYRDDPSRLSEHPLIKETEFPCPIDSKTVWIVDDVLYTGRTVRCALDALFDFGRPKNIKLAVLVDRGGRELPIQADAVGFSYKGKSSDKVQVKLKEIDKEDEVVLISSKE
jgi:pyrimidine operon attenuation protein/uracil phosphoribosyltransferase